MSDRDTASTTSFVEPTPSRAALAQLLLAALDITIRHDLRPSLGPFANEVHLAARQQTACEIVRWALGRTG